MTKISISAPYPIQPDTEFFSGLLLESARRRSDGKAFLDFIGDNQDLVARECHYHKSCFRQFAKRPTETAEE